MADIRQKAVGKTGICGYIGDGKKEGKIVGKGSWAFPFLFFCNWLFFPIKQLKLTVALILRNGGEVL
jgi:hypothetical protein